MTEATNATNGGADHQAAVPDKPTLAGLEQKWDEAWEAAGVYKFDRTKTRDEVFSIDTPPPTVSGSLHLGHVFGYTQADAVARFQRMHGKAVFYPMGWDDNGLPTERRVQNYYGVTCDPSLPYQPDFPTPPMAAKDQKPVAVSRPNFVELCLKLVTEDEKIFEGIWRQLGLSVDWALTYSSIDKNAQRVSQRAFLRNLSRGEAYQSDAPTIWDVDFQTAVAQAELEDREQPGAYHRLAFHGDDGDVFIETTRPELLPACVALVAHPDDERYKSLFGTEVRTPLFGVKVPVVAHRLAEPDKGSGIAMICTFGDTNDVVWWREMQLPTRTIVRRDGRLGELDFTQLPTDKADAAAIYQELVGLKVKMAQKKIVELLVESGELIGDPKPITHAVKFYEKGDRPLEIVSSRQWFIRTLGKQDEFIASGQRVEWHPPYMRARFEDWTNNLNSDWLISRQRYFGVPFPVWYPVNQDGEIAFDSPIVPDESILPIDPSTDVPVGYTSDQRAQPGGFIGDPDIMDTWATSSLTPQLATGWVDDDDLFARTFPMDLRPQGHDIIRTWLFSTVVRAQLENNSEPWRHTMLNGWILDPDRKKMSKSKGNVVTPKEYLDEYGSDAVRYWACSARPGTDTAFDIGQMKNGRRLGIKILNATKFVLSFPAPPIGAEPTEPVDLALLARLANVIDEATEAFNGFDYSRALDKVEEFFWSFCDDYLELVKGRAYRGVGNAGAASAAMTLRIALSAMQRMFAPFVPFVADEVWSWWQEGSIHAATWPTTHELSIDVELDDVLAAAASILADVRRAKSEAKVSQRARVASLNVTSDAATINNLRLVEADLREAGSIDEFNMSEGEAVTQVTLADS